MATPAPDSRESPHDSPSPSETAGINSSPSFPTERFEKFFTVFSMTNSSASVSTSGFSRYTMRFSHFWGSSAPSQADGQPGDVFFLITPLVHRIFVKLETWTEWKGLLRPTFQWFIHPKCPGMVIWIDETDATWITMADFLVRCKNLDDLAELHRSRLLLAPHDYVVQLLLRTPLQLNPLPQHLQDGIQTTGVLLAWWMTLEQLRRQNLRLDEQNKLLSAARDDVEKLRRQIQDRGTQGGLLNTGSTSVDEVIQTDAISTWNTHPLQATQTQAQTSQPLLFKEMCIINPSNPSANLSDYDNHIQYDKALSGQAIRPDVESPDPTNTADIDLSPPQVGDLDSNTEPATHAPQNELCSDSSEEGANDVEHSPREEMIVEQRPDSSLMSTTLDSDHRLADTAITAVQPEKGNSLEPSSIIIPCFDEPEPDTIKMKVVSSKPCEDPEPLSEGYPSLLSSESIPGTVKLEERPSHEHARNDATPAAEPRTEEAESPERQVSSMTPREKCFLDITFHLAQRSNNRVCRLYFQVS
ncbi:hypothetical protein H0H81_007141 [Sphagnurus paluster]|uniref:Uncharacterized protein n=1 Tax=Sphagnurus paluster TaxID=117069 RepID=A0A9P7GKT9_9AGAR|nr:hypothetical protein H0H81_007141 [Sphagnurus paluster]